MKQQLEMQEDEEFYKHANLTFSRVRHHLRVIILVELSLAGHGALPEQDDRLSRAGHPEYRLDGLAGDRREAYH